MEVPASTALVPEVLPPVHNRLMSDGRKTQRLIRADLMGLELPPATDSFQPIAHSTLIDCLEEALAFRHISIVRDEFAVSPDGMKLFGLLELNADFEGVRFAIGLRNANDKSMRLGMVAGGRVTVCDNMTLSGDFKPLLAKHTKNLDLTEAVALGVDRIQRGFELLRHLIEGKRQRMVDDDLARLIIYRAFIEQGFPVRAMPEVHRHYFEPEYETFSSRTVWSLENAFTSAFKELNPMRQFAETARLGKLFQNLLN